MQHTILSSLARFEYYHATTKTMKPYEGCVHQWCDSKLAAAAAIQNVTQWLHIQAYVVVMSKFNSESLKRCSYYYILLIYKQLSNYFY